MPVASSTSAMMPTVAKPCCKSAARFYLNIWMSMKRFARLTLCFSKKVENLKAAANLHFAHYNFVRLHRTTRVTPAMAAGASDRLWTLEELVAHTSR